MSAGTFYLDAWTTLPMVGQRYEFVQGDEARVGVVEVAKIMTNGRLLVTLEGGGVFNTILPLLYRPVSPQPGDTE